MTRQTERCNYCLYRSICSRYILIRVLFVLFCFVCFGNLNVIKYLEQLHLLLFILDNLFLYYEFWTYKRNIGRDKAPAPQKKKKEQKYEIVEKLKTKYNFKSKNNRI